MWVFIAQLVRVLPCLVMMTIISSFKFVFPHFTSSFSGRLTFGDKINCHAKGGEFHISHDASLHTILSSFRTNVILSVQQDATVDQQWKVTCFADETFCTFAVWIFLRFSFYYSKYILFKSKEVFWPLD